MGGSQCIESALSGVNGANCTRRGYRCVTRITRWGNPYKVADHGREEAVRLYRAMLERMTPDELRAYLAPLRGATCLACSCKADELCHADVLIEYLEKVTP